MYRNGTGVLQDNVYSHMWLNTAAYEGHKNAKKNRDIIAKEMTPAQIAEAQKLARECVAKDYKGCWISSVNPLGMEGDLSLVKTASLEASLL
tara:strand:- start:11 stop:286 length:276 start_codon:yes stop_codon:yes gene_type:complete